MSNNNKLYKVFYNPQEDVIEIDVSDLDITMPLAVEIFDEITRLAKSQTHKVYTLACWRGAKMSPEIKDYYAVRMAELLPYIKGSARYEVTNFLTKVGLKVSSMNVNATTTIFTTREEALEAIRSGKV